MQAVIRFDKAKRPRNTSPTVTKPTNEVILGVDQGTTSTRVIAFLPDGTVPCSRSREHKQYFPQPAWVEHDPNEIWENTKSLLIETALDSRLSGKKIVGVAIANPGETVLGVDLARRKAIGRAIVWQDSRTEAALQKLKSDLACESEVRSRTGLALDPYFSASKMKWIHENGSPNASFATIDTWLVLNLTDFSSYVTDASTAARTLLYNIFTQTYDPYLLKLFSIDQKQLPKVLSSKGTFGVISKVHPKLDGIPILASMVDQPAALLGHGCTNAGDFKATFGTGCFVYQFQGSDKSQAPKGVLKTLVWASGNQATYALDGGVFTVGSVLEWLKRELGFFSDANEIERVVHRYLSRERAWPDLTFLPALAGLGSPHWNRSARGAWIGLELGTTKDDLLFSVLEGICFRVKEILIAMGADSSKNVLKLDGGLARSESFAKLLSLVLGRPVEIAENPESTVFGVSFLAGLEAGWFSSLEEIAKILPPGNQIRSQDTGFGINERFKKFKKAIDQTLV